MRTWKEGHVPRMLRRHVGAAGVLQLGRVERVGWEVGHCRRHRRLRRPGSIRIHERSSVVAILVGPRAPLALQPHRVSCVLDEWDTARRPSMGPIIDGPLSKQVYYDCLVPASGMRARRGVGRQCSPSHLGGGSTFVRHAFESGLRRNDAGTACYAGEDDAVPTVDTDEDVRRRFEWLVQPSLGRPHASGRCTLPRRM